MDEQPQNESRKQSRLLNLVLGGLLSLVTALSVLALIFQPSQGRAQNMNNPPDCDSKTTNCVHSASNLLTGVTWNPSSAIVCIDDSITATAEEVTMAGLAQIVEPDSTCTNFVVSGSINYPVSFKYTSNFVSGPGGYTHSGSGLSATFSPTNHGVGSISFTRVAETNGHEKCGIGSEVAGISSEFKVIRVGSLSPDEGVPFDDGDGDPDTQSYLVPADHNGDVTVTATSDPLVAESDLPSSWTLAGGTGSGKLVRTVSKSTAGTTTITATAGSSSKSIKLQVTEVKFGITDGVCVDDTITMNVTVTPPLPPGKTATLRLTTTPGTGGAIFGGDDDTKDITGSTAVVIKGVTASSVVNNIRLSGEINGTECGFEVFSVVEVILSPSTFSGCEGDEKQFHAVGKPTGGTYEWNPAGDVTGADGENNSFVFGTSGNQLMAVTYKVGTVSCGDLSTGTIDPNIGISILPTSFNTCVGVTNTFIASGGPGSAYVWNPAGVVSADGRTNAVAFAAASFNQTVTASYSGSCVNDALATGRVRKTQLIMQGVADQDEETIGGFIGVNDDDDNLNSVADRKEDNVAVANENDLVPVTLEVGGMDSTDDISLAATWTGTPAPHIRIWDSPQRGPNPPVIDNAKQNKLNKTWKANQIPNTLYVEAVSTSTLPKDVSLFLFSPGCDDRVRITIPTVEIHPVDRDFNNNKEGRILISTKSDNKYYTKKKTTKADTPAQTVDQKVNVTVHMTPTNMVGQTIHFRVVDPDPDDLSSYEPDTDPGDNKATTDKAGKLSATQDVAQLKTINGKIVAAAEVELEVTDQFAGDNYQVETSLKPDFNLVSDKTSTLVAWKRIYVEQDNMYQKGGTVVSAFTPDSNNADDVLTLDNADDFSINDPIRIFTAAGAGRNRIVLAKTATTITIRDLDISLPEYSGVKLRDNNDVFSVPTGLFQQAYGADTDGSDGGTFVEYFFGISGSNSIPKYTTFPNDIVSFAFCQHWFANSSATANTFQLVAADKHIDGSFGTTRAAVNISFVTTGNFSFSDNLAAIGETATHEVGHQFDLSSILHIDNQGVSARNHENTDECVMSYDRIRDNNIAEFDIECINAIRGSTDPR